MSERRRSIRSDGLVLVNYKAPALQIESKSSAFDISTVGVSITAEQKFKTGTLVEMEIYLPGDSQPILAKGEVIWSHKSAKSKRPRVASDKEYFYVGIQFTVIGKNNKTRINDYVSRKSYRNNG